MLNAQSRGLKFTVNLLWLLMLPPWKPLESAQRSGVLHLDKTLQWEQKYVAPFAFAPDGKMVAACGMDWVDDFSLPSVLRLWSVHSGEKVLDLTIPGAKIISIAFGRDGQRLFTGSYDGVVRMHDLHTLKAEIIPGALGQAVTISPDGTLLAISAGQVVRMVDLASNKIIATKRMEDALNVVPCPIAFSPDGKVVAIAREDRLRVQVHEIELCHPRTLDCITLLRDEAPAVTTLSYSPDGSILAAGADDGTVVIWDVKALKRRQKLNVLTESHTKGLAEVVFAPAGMLLGVGGTGIALLLKVDTLEVVDKIKGKGVFTLAFSKDGKLLLTSSSFIMQGHETRLWKVAKPD